MACQRPFLTLQGHPCFPAAFPLHGGSCWRHRGSVSVRSTIEGDGRAWETLSIDELEAWSQQVCRLWLPACAYAIRMSVQRLQIRVISVLPQTTSLRMLVHPRLCWTLSTTLFT
jgi:hypothetical protein